MRQKSMMILLAAATLSFGLADSAAAGTFRRTVQMDLIYAWGTSSIEEFHEVNDLYPGYLPVAEITFYRSGLFDAYDTGSGDSGGGVYDKRGRNLELTLVPDGPFGTVEYVGRRVSGNVYEGEILVNGAVWGHWQGTTY